MAVGSRRTDSNSRYDPEQGFTSDQLHRFGRVANRAQIAREQRQREEEFDQVDDNGLVKRAKKRAMKPIVARDSENGQSIRYAIWLSVALICLLWLMYMTA
ncbi:hypothetical protein VII00023_12136 [Vibrio ichthyoenteri ATCC 700023]|uniref:Uncharacterized protein n=1 Tax=Vibrio ichthyoenteri ATCC 700023 TaxID=870968 RepID=F9RYR0_9VIBR|nr:hypothetical protein [Vibrio ichthyoenteri]EGU46336.1 hypothetical protein VII00023_12136 [Vibrio ichthyoenteri ATCC 700023]